MPVFGVRLTLERFRGSANVAWYRYWHEVFLREALHQRLAQAGSCVIYAQCPLAVSATLESEADSDGVVSTDGRNTSHDHWGLCCRLVG